VFGDLVAHRLASGGRAFAACSGEAALRLAENLVEYWTEDNLCSRGPPTWSAFAATSMRCATTWRGSRSASSRLSAAGKG